MHKRCKHSQLPGSKALRLRSRSRSILECTPPYLNKRACVFRCTRSERFRGHNGTPKHTVEHCHGTLSFARVYRVGVWFRVVRSALLLAIVTCMVLPFEAMPGRCFFLRVTHCHGIVHLRLDTYGILMSPDTFPAVVTLPQI